MEELYEDIGKKLKGLAAGTFIVEAVGSTISGIVMLVNEAYLAGLLTTVLGVLVAWVSSWFLYAIGELVDKTCQNERNTTQMLQILKAQAKKEAAVPQKTQPPVMKAKPLPLQTEPIKPKEERDKKTAAAGSAEFVLKDADTIVCQQCQQAQPANRRVCWNCGARFQWETAPSHKWRCAKCGNMVDKSPCPYCGEAD